MRRGYNVRVPVWGRSCKLWRRRTTCLEVFETARDASKAFLRTPWNSCTLPDIPARGDPRLSKTHTRNIPGSAPNHFLERHVRAEAASGVVLVARPLLRDAAKGCQIYVTDVPKREGELCPQDQQPVVRLPLPFTEHFILYCPVCGSSWRAPPVDQK